jgi:hypothetical protein
MKMLYGFHGQGVGQEASFYGIYDSAFEDSGKLSEWAKTPVYWGVYHEIINIPPSPALRPGEILTAADLAAIMVRYAEAFQISKEAIQ